MKTTKTIRDMNKQLRLNAMSNIQIGDIYTETWNGLLRGCKSVNFYIVLDLQGQTVEFDSIGNKVVSWNHLPSHPLKRYSACYQLVVADPTSERYEAFCYRRINQKGTGFEISSKWSNSMIVISMATKWGSLSRRGRPQVESIRQ